MIRNLKKKILIACTVWLTAMPSFAVSEEDHVVDMKIDETAKVITVVLDDAFGAQEFTEKQIRKIYKRTAKEVHKALPKEYRKYEVQIVSHGAPLSSLMHGDVSQDEKKKHHRKHHGWWGNVEYEGNPWVTNISVPYSVTDGLNGRHLSIWASHGRYYDVAKAKWKWQRVNLYGTNEDLFTQTIVVPYLIPMLERAGANVFTPRERDWQTEEIVVDNDDTKTPYYKENTLGNSWKDCSVAGFMKPSSNMLDNENPFEKGTVRQTSSTKGDAHSTACYQPYFNKPGRYAVYVSYATMENSIDDALYSVYHQGQRTDFRVNQRMGGSTWVYLGTFDFDGGCSEYNRVVVSSASDSKGVVTTDAVRFGGGMGTIERGGSVSGMPRCLEGARYYAQYAGAPYNIYGGYNGEDDYKDDINVRSLMTNWLAGGSPYAPDRDGKHVPIDLSLAIHSDAGYHSDLKSIYGGLAICTTDFNNGKLAAGQPRSRSKDFCQQILEQTKKDLKEHYGSWEWRDLYDRNYSESRLPAMPSAIFETLSHQSFPDMMMAHDPDFKFTLARSIYKTILRYEAKAHGTKAVVSPLAPTNFAIKLDKQGNATLTWLPKNDKTESTATPSSYNIYRAIGGFGYDNGNNIKGTSYTTRIEPDLMYRFYITAVNSGGESFPTEELCVVWHGADAKNVLIVNGFQRLSGPTVVDEPSAKGFDLRDDIGVSYGLTAGWAGEQLVFATNPSQQVGGEMGTSGNELAGSFIMGNTFNYTYEHAAAIASANRYNIVSCTKAVAEWGGVRLSDYDCVDLLLGNEKYDGHSLQTYKTISPEFQKQLLAYRKSGRGSLLVSGSYVASDLATNGERDFLRKLLSCELQTTLRGSNGLVKGLQRYFNVTNSLNPLHYATIQSDVLQHTPQGFIAMQYADGQTAAVASNSTGFNTFTMGFPFECITEASERAVIMRGILSFLIR